MNERIYELSKIAYTNHLERNPHSSFGRRYDYDKEFAELIVRECSGIVQNYMSRWPEDCDLVIKIKEHFGVTEE
jgi:hypothetical protein